MMEWHDLERITPPPWAREEFERWRRALQARKEAEAAYNRWLTEVDRHHSLLPLEQARPVIAQLQVALNELLQSLDAALRLDHLSPWRQRLIRRWMGPVLETQRTYVHTLVHLMNELLDYLRDLTERLHRWTSLQVQFLQQITPMVDTKVREVIAQEDYNVTVNVGRAVEQARTQAVKEALRRMPETPEMARIYQALIEINELQTRRTSQEHQAPPPAEALPPSDLSQARSLRYYIFEQIFRGSSEWLREKFRLYIDYFRTSPEPIVDLGCGRGEFLSLMRELGKDAYGIEINEVEVDMLRSRGYRVVQDDAIHHLMTLEPESIGGVFCAQVVEHLPPDRVVSMIQRLSVVMKPGAPLVIETLNPLSVFGFHHVYLIDPTHIYPVHPEALTFFMRYYGFRDVQVFTLSPVPPSERIAPPPDLTRWAQGDLQRYLEEVAERLNRWLYADVEYYAIGWKPAP